MHCWFYFVLENSCSKQKDFLACPNILNQYWIADCFVRRTWCALCVLFCDVTFLLEAFGILSLCNYFDNRIADC